jgi:CBS domain-containing protein
MKIAEILSAKPSREVVTIAATERVRALVALLAERNIGAVIVSGDGRSVDGIVSERDVVRRLGADPEVLDATVGDIMTASVHSVASDETLDATRRLMTEHRFRHVPVVDGGRLVGIVSIGDVVKAHIDQVEFERDQLDSYVHQS